MTNKGHPYHTESSYEDKGCRLHPRCQECPEPDCIYDSVNKRIDREAKAKRWAAEIKGLQEEGLTIRQIAAELGISVRQVHQRVEVGTASS